MSYIQYIVMAPDYIVSLGALCAYVALKPSSVSELRAGLHFTLSVRRTGASETPLGKPLKASNSFIHDVGGVLLLFFVFSLPA